MTGLFAQHPLQGVLHHEPKTIIDHACARCAAKFHGVVREVLEEYREHVLDAHLDDLEDCDCCGCYHF